MSGTLRLREHEERLVALGAGDAAYLAREFGGDLSVRRALAGDGYLVNPHQFVGVLALPSGIRLEAAPKVPVGTLFSMLAVAAGLPSPFRDEAADFADLDELLEFVAAHFAGLVEERVARGLYRAYAEREENLPAVRGRIAVAEDLRRNHVLRHRTWCRFAEFTWDVPENRAIRQVVHLLGGWVRGQELRLRLRRLDRLMGEVSPTPLPAGALDRIAYHRLNEDYRPIHRLCRLFLGGASLSEGEGIFPFPAFLLDMNRLFEAFVTAALRQRARPPVAVGAQERMALDEDRSVGMRPDLVVRRDGRAVLVADCKYKRPEPGRFHEHDVYQLLAYCTAMGLPRGLLIYPRHELPVGDEVRVRHAGVRIRRVSLDLRGDPEQLVAACDDLFRQVVGWGGT